MDVSATAIVVKIRIVAHTMGMAGWDKSRNHWSIYLILAGEATSVRLNMSLESGGADNGTFSATPYHYVLSSTCLRYFDYSTCNGLSVGQCLNLIYDNHRQNYQMTESGNGCRF